MSTWVLIALRLRLQCIVSHFVVGLSTIRSVCIPSKEESQRNIPLPFTSIIKKVEMETIPPTPCIEEDENSDDEYDDVLVALSFPDFDKTDFLKNEKSLKFEGLTSNRSTGKSKCTIGGYVFEGQHEHTLGTQLFFLENQNSDAKDRTPASSSSSSSSSSSHSFLGMTSFQSTFELREIVQTKEEYKQRKALEKNKTRGDNLHSSNGDGKNQNVDVNDYDDDMNIDDRCTIGIPNKSQEMG